MKQMKYMIYVIVCALISFIFGMGGMTVFAQSSKFADVLDKSTQSIQQNFNDTKANEYYAPRGDGLKTFIYDIVYKFVFPLLLISSILIVVLGLYDIMFSSKDDMEKGMKYIIYGVLGIVLIQSAKFITGTYEGIVTSVAPFNTSGTTISFTESAYRIYSQLVMPFVNVFSYIVIGTLFVILLIHVMRFITSSDDNIANKAKSIVISNVVGIVVILMAKTMVEAIYGKQSTVVKATNPSDLGDIGTGILGNADFTIVFTIINYMLGFLGFAILVIIIVQTYQLLTNPTSDDLIKKIKNNMLYVVVGLAIIAGTYIIMNFIIIN